jgi:serine protease
LQQFTEQTVYGLATLHSFEIEKVFNRSLSRFVATLNAEQLLELRSDQQMEFIEQNQVITLDPIFSTNANACNSLPVRESSGV